ncbi:ThiF family adenylyltransferase [Aneurinibacillus thermoaerophilus]|uniref:ThiF family adenylyltransferase n=1 Tax=Aneurinibacillus thermoaerophilus TaxID=143495 RepID=UPI002E21DFD1|nr:ThiF family adenylyltransferase [Aneurinibacillus thermoaerophilus]MED0677674.1 ThiF family adenylyltransferase [Aneurinibacillus thermoaerophilus]
MQKGLKIKDDRKERLYFAITVVGCGGNGSHFVRNLCQLTRTYLDKDGNEEKLGMELTLVDADKVEAKNIGNQLFDVDDLYDYKAVALAERYGYHYELPIMYVKEYVKTIEQLKSLFPKRQTSERTQVVNILVGMVDNNRTRQVCHDFFYDESVQDLIWLDAGVEGVTVFEKDELTAEEQNEIDSSGFSGQICCGVKCNGEVILEPVTEVYSNILEDTRTSFPDESCGELIVNNPQRLMTNQLAAQLATVFINNLYHTGQIFMHYINFNSQYGNSRPVFINESQIEKLERLMKC